MFRYIFNLKENKLLWEWTCPFIISSSVQHVVAGCHPPEGSCWPHRHLSVNCSALCDWIFGKRLLMTTYVSPPALFTPPITYWIYWLFFFMGWRSTGQILGVWEVSGKGHVTPGGVVKWDRKQRTVKQSRFYQSSLFFPPHERVVFINFPARWQHPSWRLDVLLSCLRRYRRCYRIISLHYLCSYFPVMLICVIWNVSQVPVWLSLELCDFPAVTAVRHSFHYWHLSASRLSFLLVTVIMFVCC